ncbi:MAG TPA: DUF4396 domain-containing protein [Candidatus Saccharibacteria bacterium]|nr:DUF4396 domain-containing protein [Candidatus Saccharibacteria bacterium]HRQ06833.1 DUF4396 domain-containing protein [Candidatus Saccharibacteria bacterium]
MDQMTKNAISATLHCLTGCAIGEILGMMIGTHYQLGNTVTVILSITLAFLFGYTLTFIPIKRSGMSTRAAIRTTLAADTISITSMEIIDNLIMIVIPGAMMAGLNSGLFWGSLATSLVLAFIVTVPVNRWLIARGKGHAVVHAMHGHNHEHMDH